MNPNSTNERQLLELAAQAAGFEYMLYSPRFFHLPSGLLRRGPDGRTRVWNPLTDDGDLLQLAVITSTASLQDIILEASRATADGDARRAYVREHFVRAVAQAALARGEAVTNDNATTAS